MRRVLLWIVGFLGAVVVLAMLALQMLGMSPTSLSANIAVGTGMGAKMACSGRFISGFDEAQIRDDLVSYSPAYEWIAITLDDKGRRATADLLGFSRTSATFRQGLGCTLDADANSPEYIGLLDRLDPPIAPQVAEQSFWPVGTQVAEPDADLVAALAQSMAQDLQQDLQTRALVLVQAGRIVAEAYAPGIAPDTPLMGWSQGKSLTALMLGWLEMRGQLSVTEENLFPVWANDSRAKISTENLLQMSSGLDFAEVYAPGSDATRMLFMDPVASALPMQSALKHPQGSHFYYSSGTTNLLTLLFSERVGGPQNALNHLYRDILWPLGMRHTTLEPDASGVFVGSSNIYASARDWARLGQLFLQQGELNGVRIASRNYMQALAQPNASSNGAAYGYQVWLNRGGKVLRWPDLPADAYAFMGNRGQVVMIIPSLDTVMVRLGWSVKDYPRNARFAEWLRVLDAD